MGLGEAVSGAASASVGTAFGEASGSEEAAPDASREHDVGTQTCDSNW